MARFNEQHTSPIYEIADKWRRESLMDGTSLLWPGEFVWTLDTLRAFKSCFTDRPDSAKDSFEVKFQRQLADQEPVVTRLACELLLIYFLFSSNVKGTTKRGLIKTVADWKGLSVDEQMPTMRSLDRGIGGAGQAYNTRRPFEIAYIANAALRLVDTPSPERTAILTDHKRAAELLEELEGDATFTSRHILLHPLFPDHYERIASGGHKARIAEAFQELAGGDTASDDIDDRLLTIRRTLEASLPSNRNLDFYHAPLVGCWDAAGESGELSPLQALEIKRQIVLYGPPGTGKTHEAKALAETLIRQGLLRAWQPKRYFTESSSVEQVVCNRVRRIQLHPGYGYEDLVRGLHLVEGGRTAYRSGVLLNIIEDLEKQPAEVRDLPFVVILDEMNRADLSKVLGECFSLLEDRGGSIQLAGQDECPCVLRMPSNLHFIGTMNLIDQSLEQVDFALRRRFLWFFYGFERDAFLTVSKYRWDEQHAAKRLPKPWDRFEAEFELFADRCVALNKLIESHPSLGRHYQVGHTYFCDVVAFAQKDLIAKPSRQQLLFNGKGEARAPIEALWRYSLRPLLEQYLSGVDEAEREGFLRQARTTLAAKAS